MKNSNKNSKTKPKDKSRLKNNKIRPTSKFWKNKITNPKLRKDTKKQNTTSNKETSNNKNTALNTL
jgi:hypothetical protein